MSVEEDGDDVGYSRISDGCLQCPTHPQLVKTKRGGGLFWCCPKCGGSYGPVALAAESIERSQPHVERTPA